MREIGVGPAQPALRQQHRDPRCRRRLAPLGRPDQHIRQRRRHREVRDPPPPLGQPACLVEGPDPLQFRDRLVPGPCRRRVEEQQPLRRPRPPTAQIEDQAGQIRFKDFGPVEGNQTARLGLVPKAIANPRLRPACPSPALIRRGARHSHRLKPAQAPARIEPRHTRQARVDHDPHALDRQAGLGDGRGQNHLTGPRRSRADRPILSREVHRAIQRRDRHVRRQSPLDQAFFRPPDFALPGQEDQDRARLLRQRPVHRADHPVLDPLRPAEVARLDRECPPLAFDDRGVQPRRDHRPVQRRRHDHQPQVVAQQALRIDRKSQPQIGVQAALVELVEQDRADSLQTRIIEDHPREDALGDHLDARPGADAAFHPDAVADRLPGLLAQHLRHASRRCPCRQTPGLQDDDPTAFQPGLILEGQGNDRGLARTRRRNQHRIGTAGQRRLQRRDRLIDGQSGDHPAPSRRRRAASEVEHQEIVIAESVC